MVPNQVVVYRRLEPASPHSPGSGTHDSPLSLHIGLLGKLSKKGLSYTPAGCRGRTDEVLLGRVVSIPEVWVTHIITNSQNNIRNVFFFSSMYGQTIKRIQVKRRSLKTGVGWSRLGYRKLSFPTLHKDSLS